MFRQRLALLALMLPAVVLISGTDKLQAGTEGHAGSAGHAPGGFYRGGFYGGFRPGFRGYYGYPGWYGVGLGVGLGCACAYGYPYYPYPYGYGYPVYVDVAGGPAPVAFSQVVPAAAQGAAPGAPGNSAAVAGPVRLTDTDVLLSIRVPAEASVRINGEKTTQTGPRREFLSSGLTPGRSYSFTVTAQWPTGANGTTLELERRISVQGGERRTIDFLMPPPREGASEAGR